MRSLLLSVLLAGLGPTEAARAVEFEGEWVTDLGYVILKIDAGGAATGTYGDSGSLEGQVDDRKLEFTWSDGKSSGSGEFTLGDDERSFTGSWRYPNGNRGGTWRGWQRDPEAKEGPAAQFGGVWLSSFGTLVLEQKGTKVEGTYGSQGWGTLEGTVRGRAASLDWKSVGRSGTAWIELTPDGKFFFGGVPGKSFTKWLGVRLEDFVSKPRAKAGEVVKGLSENAMAYYLRAPDKWRKRKKTDAIVLLHGSNWTTAGMVHVTARQADLGEKYMIIGIQGEQWADWSSADDARFNYTYVNYMGKSTYEGYPNTDRESPALVAEVIAELKKEYRLDRIFIGGHSQGGYLSFVLHMHFPELFAGIFPMSCGLIIQAEPDVFEGRIREQQRATPLAIVHGKSDKVVAFSSGQYSYQRFVQSEFPLLRLITSPGGHPYDFLPIADTINWLDAMSTKDKKNLQKFAQERAASGAWRDVAAALRRARAIGAAKKLGKVADALQEAAAPGVERFTPLVRANADGAWIDEFLEWYGQFEFAPSAERLVRDFRTLRKKHDPPADELIAKARQLFQSGDQAAAYAQYEAIAARYYCASRYPVVKEWLAQRK